MTDLEFKIEQKAKVVAKADVTDFIKHVKSHELYDDLKDKIIISYGEDQKRPLDQIFHYEWGVDMLIEYVIHKYKRFISAQVFLAAEKVLDKKEGEQ